MGRPHPSRRRLLTSLSSAVAVATLAGCTGSEDTDGSGDGDTDGAENGGTDEQSTGDDDPDTDGADGGDTDGGEDLDVREANVVGVAFEGQDGTSTFDVTLHHDDDGEEGYANWWQVERLDGTRLGRRDLLHAHSQQPFTRSETIDVPAEVTCVVVRGHDQTHGYGGQAAVIDLDSGETRTVDQGADRQSFDGGDCP